MQTKKIQFKNKEGIFLSAAIDFPISGKPEHYAIFAHCFTCNKNLNAVRSLSSALTKNQIAVLRFDFTGLGESEGSFSDSNFSSNISDIISAGEFLEENYKSPEILVGHSLGGAGVLNAAEQLNSVKAIASIAAPSHPEHVRKLFSEEIEAIKEQGEAEVNIGGRPFKIKKQFLEDISQTNYDYPRHKNRPSVLIMHSPQDEIVEIKNARDIYEGLKHPKSFITLDGSDHLLSKKEDAIYAGEMIAHWAMRYLSSSERDKIETNQKVAVRTYAGSFTSEVVAGAHNFIADEPKDSGGDDLGASPYDLLLAALGTCTSMTIKMYMDRKKWNYESIEVHLSHEHIHEEDAKNSDNPSGKIDRISRLVKVDGELNDEQQKKVLEIANKCPVHRSLHSPTQVNTSWWT